MSKIDLYKGDFIIENKKDKWYIASWSGDPGRTFIIEHAKRYKTKAGANRAILYFLKRYPYRKMELSIEVYNIAKKRIEDTAVEKDCLTHRETLYKQIHTKMWEIAR